MVAFWNALLKSFSWTHFVLKIYDFFSGGRLYARVAKLKFHNVSRESRNARKCWKSEKMQFLRHFWGGPSGPWNFFRLPWVFFIGTKKITYLHEITHLQINFFVILVLDFFLICSYLSLKNWSFSNNLRPGGTNLLVNHQKFKAHSYRVGQWS